MSTPTDREILITRTLDAPPELVWRAWTDPKQIVKWWGPDGFTTTNRTMNVRPGGEWRFDMHGPDGRNYPNKVVFEEVVEPSRLVYSHRDDDANLEPVSFHVTVTFEKDGEKTRLTLRMAFPSTEERNRVIREYGAVDGGMQTVGRLADHLAGKSGNHRATLTIALPSDCEILMSRTFQAPRRMVWDAMTKPELIKQWVFSPPGWTLTDCKEDVRVGGSFRWTWHGPDGQVAMVMHGEYLEVRPPELVSRREVFELGCQGCIGELVATIVLTESNGRTTLKMTTVYPNKEARDGMLASGMEQGVSAGYDKLETMLAGTSRK